VEQQHKKLCDDVSWF